jgi:hypothetical protein
MKKTKVKYYINENGVRIKKCCASCQFAACTSNIDARLCQQGEGNVSPKFVCYSWQIKDEYSDISLRGDGRIRTQQYIQWLSAQRIYEKNHGIKPREVRELEREYVKEFKVPKYLNI